MGIDRALFIDEVPDDCICCICQEVLEDPRETLTCQHAFCQTCISLWLEEHTSCPSCRCPLSLGDLVTLHRVWRDKLNRLQLRCQNYRTGCDAVLWLEKWNCHYASCPFTRVTCPHSPCSELVLRSMLPSHVETCEYRQVTCKSCQLRVPFASLNDHDCIRALREDFLQRMESCKREWSYCFRAMRREHRKLEEKVLSQAGQIADLRGTIAVLTGRRKPVNTCLPAVNVTGSALRISNTINSTHPTRSTRRDSRPGPGGANVSLPRLAPLHTHMSLSRNSGQFSGKFGEWPDVGYCACSMSQGSICMYMYVVCTSIDSYVTTQV